MSVTNIIMLVKDRPKLTQQTLRTLFRTTPTDQFNLVLVDDGSSDYKETVAEILHLYLQRPNVAMLQIWNSKSITGQARNLGIYWAEKYWGRGDYLYLSDNDMYFTPGWLGVLTSTLDEAPVVSMLGGWNHPYLQPKPDWERTVPHGRLFCHDAVTGASQLMRWTTWDTHGPLDAHAPGVGQSEDWAMCQSIIKAGGVTASLKPYRVLNCGLTNSLGNESPGADRMLAELEAAKATYPDLIWA